MEQNNGELHPDDSALLKICFDKAENYKGPDPKPLIDDVIYLITYLEKKGRGVKDYKPRLDELYKKHGIKKPEETELE